MEPVPNFANLLQQHLRRMDWGDFPDVVIHAEESRVKEHPRYAAAKAGDVYAAKVLVLQTMASEAAVESVPSSMASSHTCWRLQPIFRNPD